MSLPIYVHVAAGSIALLAGALALVVRKGGRAHARVGTAFTAAMLVMGITASVLAPFKVIPDRVSLVGGLFVCYLVVTAWWSVRRRDGVAGRFEIFALGGAFTCTVAFLALGLEGLISPGGAVDGYSPAVPFSNGGLALFAMVLDARLLVRGKLTGRQRLTRHVWRICTALFMASSAFFLGQQDVMPEGVRGSWVLFVLAFMPLAAMTYWLVRMRLKSSPAHPRRSRAAPDAASPELPRTSTPT